MVTVPMPEELDDADDVPPGRKKEKVTRTDFGDDVQSLKNFINNLKY